MSERVRTAIITGAVGLAVVVAVRLAMRVALQGYLARLGARQSAGDVAGARTRFVILQRLVTAILLVIVAWSVLQVFPSTNAIGRSLLASGAVLTIFLGIALTGPLSNVGAGVLLGLSQSVRLGDRHDRRRDGADDRDHAPAHGARHGRRAARVRAQLAARELDRHEPLDRRPAARRDSSPPARLGTSIEAARHAVLSAVEGFQDSTAADTKVVVADLTESTVWLALSVHLRRTATSPRSRPSSASSRWPHSRASSLPGT